jgi:hypothetical protein
MFKKFASLVLVIALICTLGGAPAFAHTSSNPDDKSNKTGTPPDSVSTGKREAQPRENLKADIMKLVADARAGKSMPSHPQIQPAQSNSLSKGAKIAIGVGIAAAVILIIALSINIAPSGNPF